MVKRECLSCKDKNVTAYAGVKEYPLCTKCWKELLAGNMTLEDLDKKADEQ